MLGNVFYWVFNMSIAGGVAGVFILLLRRIKKIPRGFIHITWLVPLFRFLLPFGLSGKYSLMSFISKFAAKTVVVYEKSDVPVASYMNYIQGAQSYFPIEYKTNVLKGLFETASIIWLCGFIALMLAFFGIYIATIKELSDSTHHKDNIYFSEKISTPAVYGIFRPRIILPLSAKNGDLKFILMHERAHIARRDNLKRFIAFLTVFIHWFNPLAWVFLKCFFADTELACDERVLSESGEREKKNYARALLCFRQSGTVFASAFGGARIKTRIENILSYKKMSLFSLILFSILCILIFYFLLTNAL